MFNVGKTTIFMGFYGILVCCLRSSVAEHQFCKLGVVGSNPTGGFSCDLYFLVQALFFWRLFDLGSICACSAETLIACFRVNY